jgi:hypothetical protein
VYNPWWLKRATWGEWARYLAQFAGPSLIGYTAPEARPVPAQDALGNPIPNAPTVSPEMAMLNTLLAFKNGTAAVFANGSKVEPITMEGEGKAFSDAIQLHDKQIAKGILCQTLATEEGEHQSRAASDNQTDVMDMVILHIKVLAQAMLRMDLAYPLVKYNWGPDIARKYTPLPQLAAVARRNWATDAGAVSQLATSGYLDQSQLPEMDARLDLPRRRPQEVGSGPIVPPAGKGTPPPAGQKPGGTPGQPGQPAAPQPGQPAASKPPASNGSPGGNGALPPGLGGRNGS